MAIPQLPEHDDVERLLATLLPAWRGWFALVVRGKLIGIFSSYQMALRACSTSLDLHRTGSFIRRLTDESGASE